jgi:subtilase family serine protease
MKKKSLSYRRGVPFASLLALLIALPTVGRTQQAVQLLHNHLPAPVAQGQIVPSAPLEKSARLHLILQLPLRNEAQLQERIERIYDPSSPEFRHYLSVKEFVAEYGPREADYQAVVNFAKANKMAILDIPANHMLVEVEATTSQVEKTFHVAMMKYRHPSENREFFAPDREPSVNFGTQLLHVTGLNNFTAPHRHSSTVLNPSTWAGLNPITNASGPFGSYAGSDMRAAYYGSGSLTGSGQSVGLVEFSGYDVPNITLYYNTLGIAKPATTITNVLVGGLTAPMGNGGDDGEPVLDIVQALNMAPGLSSLRVYECCASSFSGSGPLAIINKMASDNISKQLSASWGWGPEVTAENPVYMEMAAQGQTFITSAGDFGPPQQIGSTTYDNNYPSDNAYVTAVGMSTLTTSGPGGSWVAETYNPGTAGGVSDGPTPVAIPSYQTANGGVANGANGASTTLRNAPDLVMNGYGFFSCGMGQCYPQVGCETCEGSGASYSAPIFAGFVALMNQKAVAAGNPTVGFLNPVLYTLGKSAAFGTTFHNIIGGTDDCCGQPAFYTASGGYNLVGGWGAMNATTAMTNILAPPTACTPTTVTPYIQVGTGAWQNTNQASVSLGTLVSLGPQPTSGGSWTWTGPGDYIATARQINAIRLASGTNTYMATYTNSSKCVSTATFTITASGTVITPYTQVNSSTKVKQATVSLSASQVTAGATVNFLPTVSPSGGTWAWSAPNQYLVPPNPAGASQMGVPYNNNGGSGTDFYSIYWATYTETNGAPILATFTIDSKY